MSIFNIMNECGHVIKIEELLSFLGVVATEVYGTIGDQPRDSGRLLSGVTNTL